MTPVIGRYAALHGETELLPEQLVEGLDFREPRHRRATFLRFYQFHLRYRSHPGCIYYVFPALAKRGGWGVEERLWFAFLNGNTQNPVTSWRIFSAFPSVQLDERKLAMWFNANYASLSFDTDRRYHKKSFLAAVTAYRALLKGGPQEPFFATFLGTSDPYANFQTAWEVVRKRFFTFGRLSAFSYLEYLRVMGMPLLCDQLFLHDRDGSRSHRNGLCKVLGRDDLDWHESNPGFDGVYPARLLEWLAAEGETLRVEAEQLVAAHEGKGDVGYFTLESALCTYKSWHRPNRRYPNVYNDLFFDRIKDGEKATGQALDLFWDIRKEALPEHLRLEDNPKDCGAAPLKQNHYLTTGQPVMMDLDWTCFRNDFNAAVNRAQATP